MEIITSATNSRVKRLKTLSTKKGRNENQLFLVEGFNIVRDIPKHITVKELVIRESDYQKYKFLEQKFDIEGTVIADKVFENIGDTVNSNGVFVTVETKTIQKAIGDKVIVLDCINDAGNYGTILRTAVAMGFSDIIAINSVDCYNSKVVRASMGGIFYVNIIETDIIGCLELLKCHYKYVLHFGGDNLYNTKFNDKFALIVGNEARGISEEVFIASDKIITIPMPSNKVESLNAGISMSIVLSYVANNFKV